jgi:outer membrane protein
MKKLTLILAMTSPLLARSALADLVIGTVNMQKILQESKRGKAAKAQLEKDIEDERKKLDKERDAIQKAGEEFQKKSAVLSEKARNEKGLELQTRMGKFQEVVSQTQMRMQQKEGELTKPILDGIRNTIPEVAKSSKVDLVFEDNTSGLLYTKEEKKDLTGDVLKAFDSKN